MNKHNARLSDKPSKLSQTNGYNDKRGARVTPSEINDDGLNNTCFLGLASERLQASNVQTSARS